MGDTPQNAGEGNEPASPFEQTQRMLNNIIEQIRGLEWSELLDKQDKGFKDSEVKIIGNNIKAEHAEEGEVADSEQQQIEVIEEVKAAERLQRNCEYVRGLCKLTIEHKRDNREAIEGAKKVLELLTKIEKGDYSLWRELEDTLFILMEALRAENEEAKAKDKKEKTDKKITRVKWRIKVWVKNHPHSYGLTGCTIFLMLFFVMGLVKAQWRNWCWAAGVTFLALILSLLGGRSSR